jgi:Yip1 domain
MDIKGAFQDAIALVKNPKAFMTARADAAPPIKSTIMNYVAILALIPLVFTLIGDAIFLRGGNAIVYAIGAGILAYISALVSVVVVSFILSWLAPKFASIADINKSAKLVSYIYTPVFLIAVLYIVPVLAILAILGLLYGLYILYIGLPIVLKTPTDKVLVYAIVTLVATFVVYFILGLIVAALLIL